MLPTRSPEAPARPTHRPPGRLGVRHEAFPDGSLIRRGLCHRSRREPARMPPSAVADPTPIQPRPASAVTADRLPTVQINGVVWSQAVVGNTVYAGGSFSQARPAGAAPGTNQTPRANLLAYDITTGNLITSFNPTLNAQVRAVAASPDGTRIYVVGDFSTANGQTRMRVAAYSTADGSLITSFAPVGVSSAARAVVATNDTVYVGGGFASAGGHRRAPIWRPSVPATARCCRGTRTPTTTFGRSPSAVTVPRCSPVDPSRTSAV